MAAPGAKLDDDALRDELREAGLRATPSRVAVLRLLRRTKTPVSHAEVTERLSHEGFDRATLYRNLGDLSQAGLARRTDLGDHVWRFESSAQGHDEAEHPHFVCNQCGTVECLDGVQVLLPRGAKGPKAIREKAVEVQLKGVCDRCA